MNNYQTGDNAVDEVIFLMYCKVMGLPIDEQVTKEITTESLILLNLCAMPWIRRICRTLS